MISTADNGMTGGGRFSRLGLGALASELCPPTVLLHGVLLVATVAGGLVAMAVERGLPFLWHLSAVPLVGGLLVGVTIPNTKEKTHR